VSDIDRPVLSVEEALERILDAVPVLGTETVDLLDAAGGVLAETVLADRDIPPTANSAMDGYAVRSSDLKSKRRLEIVGQVRAGGQAETAVQSGTVVRIMTGAPMPPGADTVVQFEDTKVAGNKLTIEEVPPAGANVRAAGEDVRAGQVVLQPGTVLRPQEIGMLAAVGRTQATVVRRPRVAITATGDEVVPPDRVPGPTQIRDANSYTVAAQVESYGASVLLLGVAPDRENLLRRAIRRAVARRADFIITSGGVSVGDFDLVKQVLQAEGEMHFWSINMKPGRPLAFGVVGNVPLLGLPGNPVSAMITTELFGRPALLKMSGFTDLSRTVIRARLTDRIAHKDGRRHYVRVQLAARGGGYEATLTGDQGSGILSSLVLADGLAIIPEEYDHLPAGSEVDVILLR
jgi:molybdopterin molybdotransferase